MGNPSHEKKPKLPKGRPQGLLLRSKPKVIGRRRVNPRVRIVDDQIQRALRAAKRKARGATRPEHTPLRRVRKAGEESGGHQHTNPSVPSRSAT